MQPGERENYRFLEVLKVLKYEDLELGEIHDIKSSLSHSRFDQSVDLSANKEKSDIVAAYELVDETRYYYIVSKPVSIYRIDYYDELKNKANDYFKKKYLFLKMLSDEQKLRIYYNIYFNEVGNIDSIDLVTIFPEMDISDYEDDIHTDLSIIVRNYPKVKPAKYRGEPVGSIATDVITF